MTEEELAAQIAEMSDEEVEANVKNHFPPAPESPSAEELLRRLEAAYAEAIKSDRSFERALHFRGDMLRLKDELLSRLKRAVKLEKIIEEALGTGPEDCYYALKVMSEE